MQIILLKTYQVSEQMQDLKIEAAEIFFFETQKKWQIQYLEVVLLKL